MGGGIGGRVIWGRLGKRVARYSSLRLLDLPDVWVREANNGVHTTGCQAVSTTAQINAGVASILDGKLIAADIKSEIASEVRRFKHGIGKHPGLAIVLVGSRSESQSFVQIKMKACEQVGIASRTVELPTECTENEVLQVVSNLNNDSSVHGIVVQLPLPEHIDEEKIQDVVSPEKDVDGFHPLNMGNLALRGREPLFIPCAAKACIELLLRSGVEIAGRNAVVIGRSKIVGLPTSLLLQRYHATVSVVHAFTQNPEIITREAEIVITDVGTPNIIRGNWLKPGAVVIDTGTNTIKDPNCNHISGDVFYEEATKVASAITPVPGGVGPVTISMLLSNILDSAKRAYEIV